jgi:hypothetical protein
MLHPDTYNVLTVRASLLVVTLECCLPTAIRQAIAKSLVAYYQKCKSHNRTLFAFLVAIHSFNVCIIMLVW